MKRFGLLIFCWLMLGLSAQATITASGTAAVCAVNSGTTITITRNEGVNNTVAVVVYVTNQHHDWVNTLTDTGGSTYTERIAAYSSGSEVLSIFSTPAGGSLASTSITIGMETTNQAIACAFEYLGVASLGNTAVNNDTSAALTVSVTTQDANNWVVGGFGQYSGSAELTQNVGTLRAALSNGTNIVSGLADNTCVSAGSCQVAVASDESAVWVAAGLELRSGAAPPAAAKRRIIAD